MAAVPTSRRGGLGLAASVPPLVMRFGAFGDMVLLTVLLRHLHARFGKPVDLISSGAWTAPLLEGQSALGRLFLVRSRRIPYWMSLDQRRLVHWLRERGAGPTWFCDRHLGKELLNRGGVPDEYIVDSRSYEWLPEEGFADRYIRLGNESPTAFAGLLPAARPALSRAAQLIISGADRTIADTWLARHGLAGQPLIFVHPGSRHMTRRWLRSRTGAEKYWPETCWAAVVSSIRALRADHAILLTGTGPERRFNQDIIARAQVANIHNVASDLPLRTLLPLLERAHSMISVDTGPAHAAAALGCPTVALFGPASTTLFRPGGATTPAVAVTGEVDGSQNILGISAEAVIEAWLGLIGTAECPQSIL